MKKVGLLMTLASLIAVGGVYATWSYGQGTAASVNDELAVVMTAATVDGKKGKFTVSTSTLKFEIGNSGNYVPQLRAYGDLVVTFTPNPGADNDVVQSGIDINWAVSFSGDGEQNWKYDADFSGGADTLIFDLDSSLTKVLKTEAAVDGAGNFVFTIPASKIVAKFPLNIESGFALDTKAKYDSFNSYLDDYKIELNISEATA